MSDKTTIGIRVANEVSKRCVPIASIAKAAGVNYNTLYSHLKGRGELTADEYLAVCDLLALPYDHFKKPTPTSTR